MFSFFKKNKADPNAGMTMDTLERGCLFEYLGDVYQVRAIHEYSWESGGRTREFECHGPEGTIYVEKDEDEAGSWLVTRKLPASELNEMILDYIREKEKPPKKVSFGGIDYRLVENSAAYFRLDGQGDEKPLLAYDYEDAAEEHSLTIEQWGDEDFSLAVGDYVEEYRFANILPAPEGS